MSASGHFLTSGASVCRKAGYPHIAAEHQDVEARPYPAELFSISIV